MARLSHRPELPWSFTILDTDVSNAFALPGGMVFVKRGLLGHLQNEAELAAVLGHEIAHVTARHGAHRANEAAFANLGVAAAINVGQFLERTGLQGAARRMKRLGLSLAAGMIATYNREQELEADRIGADDLARAGYEAREMVGLLQMLQMIERFHADRARESQREASGSDWLPSHLGTDQRLREAERYTAIARHVNNDGRQRFCSAWAASSGATAPRRATSATASSCTRAPATPSRHRQTGRSTSKGARWPFTRRRETPR